ncbi:Sucraseferredoxin family protein [Amycolatopsis camponoti]|uniref:Sucraseferredoxin family protein n=2 Tax=Pseudonocardiaceae TaxID=2070 RepID=A0A6I8LMB7_9PSEU|nr:Sucraseferredoxin family protein [Amycolatopsis camponoti]
MPKSGFMAEAGLCSPGPTAAPACAALTRELGGEPAGTAARMTSWLLIEQPGSWGPDALEDVLAEALPAGRLEAARDAGLRPLLIRKPGRHALVPGAPRTVYVASGRPGHRWLERLDAADLAGLDFEAVAAGRGGHGEPVSGPLFLVCTHGSKDMCCAVFGRPVVTGLAQNHPGQVWEVSHVGGDRWAGNLLTVPDGYLHGSLAVTEAELVAKEALSGNVRLENLRGRTSAESPWSQFAEIEIRGRTGLRGLDAVLATEEEPGGDVRKVLVTGGARRYEVVVRRKPSTAAGHSRCSARVVLAAFETESVREL